MSVNKFKEDNDDSIQASCCCLLMLVGPYMHVPPDAHIYKLIQSPTTYTPSRHTGWTWSRNKTL